MLVTAAHRSPPRGLFRVTPIDARLVAAAALHGVLFALLVISFPAWPARGLSALLPIALGVWWTSNTVSHIHLHRPLFRSRPLNRAFSLYLTVLLGVPQSIWRARHLLHHAGAQSSSRTRAWPRQSMSEIALIVLAWSAMALLLPAFFFAAFLPGYLVGLLLCRVQGTGEHADARIDGISVYDALYNRLWFNDGYHVEHHLHPDEHWTRLPAHRRGDTPASALPPVLRPLARATARAIVRPLVRLLACTASLANRAQARVLVLLEHLALASPRLQRFMIDRHAQAFAALLPTIAERRPIRRVCIVGGGLFPRTALVLRRLIPDAHLTLLDRSGANLERAHACLLSGGLAGAVDLDTRDFDSTRLGGFDVVVIPLALVGDREAVYCLDGPFAASSDGPALLVHDWIWRRRGRAGRVISLLLMKRLNLV